jgi:di/tricarboxylate transporter
VISNIGACIVLIPLISSLAIDAGFDPRPLILLVGVCVSNAFLLPTNQVSAIIQGPGGYSSKDFIKVGSGLSVIYIATVIAMINWLY